MIRTLAELVDLDAHPLADPHHADDVAERLDRDGAVVLGGLLRPEIVAELVRAHEGDEHRAFFAASTHNVYLTEGDPEYPADHPANRQVVSSKGLIADDEIPSDSPLRTLAADPVFVGFLARVLGVEQLHPYADPLSSINVHFAPTGRELGWHFDNSSFAVTLLLRAPEGGGTFEYVPSVRTDTDPGHAVVDAVLDARIEPSVLAFDPGDLVLFRGRHALHRVTPTEGRVTRLLVVLAYNDAPGVRLSDSALRTFYGRAG